MAPTGSKRHAGTDAEVEHAGEAAGGGAVLVTRGARAAEALLLDALEAHAREVREDPRLLALPVRVVVPSRSLREHVAAALVRRLGGATAGVSLHTLRGLAVEILGACGESARGGELLFRLQVRRLAQRHAVLRRRLDDLADGYGVVLETVADLLDAGFEAALREPLEDAAREHCSGKVFERVRALVEVAHEVVQALHGIGLEHRSGLFRRAREALERDPGSALPARAVWVHGYADATGVQAELLSVLAEACGARFVVDRPDDPACPGEPDPGVRFTERLGDRLGAPRRARAAEPPRAPVPELVRAPGAQAEARAVAERVVRCLDAGARPEAIGIVARDLAPYAMPLRAQLGRLGVPFSGAPGVVGPPAPKARFARALLALLREGPAVGCDRWLDVQGGLSDRASRDLRLAFHAVGAGRLRDAAGLPVDDLLGDRVDLALPARRRARAGEGGSDADEATPETGENASEPGPLRASVGRALLEEAVQRASRLAERLAGWPERAEAEEHLNRLASMLRSELEWGTRTPGAEDVDTAAETLRSELAGAGPIGREELLLLLERLLEEAGATPFGGQGGGVQVLRAEDARARTFEHLFVMGLNRDLFPRPPSEDPLLPDREREALEPVLAAIPLKRRGFDEERHLFAELLSSSPRVTLSWQSVTDEGRERPPSPLVERLRLERGLPLPALAPAAVPAGAVEDEGVACRTAPESALRAGLAGGPSRLRAILPVALREAWREGTGEGPPVDPAALAEAHVAVLAEIDPRGAARGRLGPYYGLLGAEQRIPVPWVTAAESYARCPWRTFLERQLGVSPVPDARAALPGLDRSLVGTLVHRVLEAIAVEGGAARGGSLGKASSRQPVCIAWPDSESMERLLETQARAVVREAGIALSGFPRILAAIARPHLERVRDVDWRDGEAPAVLAAEAEGSVVVPDRSGGRLELRFRADRVDAWEGGLALTDYKSGSLRDPKGQSVSEARKPETRRERLLAAIGAGHHLQAAAYAFSAPERSAKGRYLLTDPDVYDDGCEPGVAADDGEGRAAFTEAVRSILDGWQRGVFFPRLLDAAGRKEPTLCKHCDVAQACLRGDSGARRRLEAWVVRRGSRQEGEEFPHEEAMGRLWALGGRRS